MRSYIAVAIFMISGAPASMVSAQAANPDVIASEKAAITDLAWMNGNWRGEASTSTPSGMHSVIQTERIGDLLGGTVKLLEGKGFNADGSVVFNAFGVISFDAEKKTYSLHSYAMGREGSFPMERTSTGYVWSIPAGPSTIRYTATLHEGIWTEVGDRIVDGKPPMRFFEMNLKRLGTSDWPTNGSLSPK